MPDNFTYLSFLSGLLGWLITLLPVAVHAQSQTLSGTTRFNRAAISPIYAGNEVKGYLLYSKADRADRKNDNYQLDFYDQDLTKVTAITLQKPAGNYFLVDNAFNGSVFSFYFYNRAARTLELETYDTGLKKIADKVVEKVSRFDELNILAALASQNQTDEALTQREASLVPVPGFGFVRTSSRPGGRTYQLQLYDEHLNLLWEWAPDPKVKVNGVELLGRVEAVDHYLLATVLHANDKNELKLSLMALDAKTGKQTFALSPNVTAQEQLLATSFTFDPVKREFVITGDNYSTSAKGAAAKSQGFCIQRFTENGQLLGIKKLEWEKDIRPLLPSSAQHSLDAGYTAFTHAVVHNANGKVYFVTEQYKTPAESLGGANMAKQRTASACQLGDILVFTLDQAYNLLGVNLGVKEHDSVQLPSMAAQLGAGIIGYYLKVNGKFAYQYTQQNEAHTALDVVYQLGGEPGTKSALPASGSIGILAITGASQVKEDKIEAPNLVATTYVYPAKSGYVMRAEYLKKERSLTIKLIKLPL